MILNNCTTCGRKPDIHKHSFNRFSHEWNHYAICGCLKHVSAIGGNIWTAEVAADMWNRANPETEMSDEKDYINYLAACVARAGFSVTLEGGEVYLSPGWKVCMEEFRELTWEVFRRKEEMFKFYKNRLQPGVKA